MQGELSLTTAPPRGGSEAPVEAPTRAQRERDLVARFRRGDQEAFEEFYREFSGLVYNLALRQCGSREQARDLTQEVFLRIFKSLSRFRGQSSLKTWTYRVCINHCRSRLGRKRLPTESLTTDDGERELLDVRRTPEERAVQEDEGRVLSDALTEVEPLFREAVVLRDLEGLAYQEIADVLEVPIGTVRSRIARGREQLRRVLGAGGAE